jgi:5'-nucleotidase
MKSMYLRRLTSAIFLCIAMFSARAQQFRVKIIAFNDLHGNLESPGTFRASPQSPEVPVGGIDFLSGYVAHLKSENPDNIVVSAGDLTGASPLVSTLFHHEDTIETANRLGLSLNAVGNHEFDQGLPELLRYQNGGCSTLDPNTCKGTLTGTPVPFEGAKFQYLAANVFSTATGKTIFPAYAIRTWHGVKVAFIGLTLKDTPTIVVPSSIRGLRFDDEAATINASVRQLRAQGVQSFVVLIHQGGFQSTKGPRDINACAGDLSSYPIRTIVSQLDDAVSLVISGHTHEAYICQLPNRSGRKIAVTSASSYGRVLTDIDLTLDTKSKRIAAIAAHNILVDRTNSAIQPDAAIRSIVDRYAAIAAPIANRKVGTITADIRKPGEEGEWPIGDLITDAQLEATASPDTGGAIAAFTNNGGIRKGLAYSLPGMSDGQVTYGELFTAQPFQNNLVTMTLTGAQIKTALEQQFKGCALGSPPGEPAPANNRMLQVSASFAYTWSRSAPPCNKVTTIKINGAAIDPTAKYRITVNNLLADGGEQLYALREGTDRIVGQTDLEAMLAYFAKHPTAAPALPTRITILP